MNQHADALDMEVQINWNDIVKEYPEVKSLPANSNHGESPMCLALGASKSEIAVLLRAETVMGATDDCELYITVVYDHFGRRIYMTGHARYLEGSQSNPPFFFV